MGGSFVPWPSTGPPCVGTNPAGRYALVSPLCGPPGGHSGAYSGVVTHLVGAPPSPLGGDRRRRPLTPGLGRGHDAGWREGVRGRFTPSPPPEDTPGALDVECQSPATVGGGLRTASSG